MRTFCLAKDSFMESVDRIAIAFGCLYKPTPNNSIIEGAYAKHSAHCAECYDVDGGEGGVRCENGTKLLHAQGASKHSLAPDRGESCQYVLFNPIDFHYFLLRSGRLRNEFDRETQQRLVKRGIVGYLWGATVALERGVVVGNVVLTSDIREKALKSKKSIIVELQQPFDVITKDFEGIAETHTDWTEDET
jgi:hypothetical protein